MRRARRLPASRGPGARRRRRPWAGSGAPRGSRSRPPRRGCRGGATWSVGRTRTKPRASVGDAGVAEEGRLAAPATQTTRVSSGSARRREPTRSARTAATGARQPDRDAARAAHWPRPARRPGGIPGQHGGPASSKRDRRRAHALAHEPRAEREGQLDAAGARAHHDDANGRAAPARPARSASSTRADEAADGPRGQGVLAHAGKVEARHRGADVERRGVVGERRAGRRGGCGAPRGRCPTAAARHDARARAQRRAAARRSRALRAGTDRPRSRGPCPSRPRPGGRSPR